MVTGVQEKNLTRFDMMKGVQDETLYCSPAIFFRRKIEKAPSTSQPQFRSENIPASIEAVQVLFALLHLTSLSDFPISALTSIELLSCQSQSPQQCPQFTGNLATSSYLKISFKQALKFTTSGLQMTKSFTSLLSCETMRCRCSETLAAQFVIIIWDKI